ncbi:pullulanase-type alpha-1,6-glucosidase [Acanthopleuribacter pedis]|uniref:pullulanase n=1 Tax=Acanthopleuribacter pedis TaxID=442870 RepID=A0A8J7QHN5_9BACT|nr:pullulanase-type alpha-1,6-glucosidase [Acanthopleuribacter pedis]MBO1320711.1 pullulanase-type alpha-1,6-glucosidase [Acanthopleuribacter pedis]
MFPSNQGLTAALVRAASWCFLLLSAPALWAQPSSATLAGSFQDELSCPGDWQPECTASGLTYDAGDDVWQATYTLPAGSYEYKVALNGSWDENYGAGATPGGDNIALNLDTEQQVRFYYDHQSNWITDNVNSVIATIPGSFQSALGCGSDWDPSCLRSMLQDIDGDGMYQFDAVLPAGDYACKVAINESWDENYGADGAPGGSDILFSVPSDDTPVSFVYDTATNILTVTVQSSGDAGPTAPAVQHAIQDETFYFLVNDRFENGDTANDYGGMQPGDTDADRLRHGYWPADKGFYHGGDIAGITNRLDYLQNMGVTAVWMTPVLRNNAVQGDSSNALGHSSGYHGYWTIDYQSIDPHMGNEEDLRNLIQAAHARGMKIYFDVVVNHTGDVIRNAQNQYSYRTKEDAPYRDAAGNSFDDRDFIGGDFPALDAASSFPYTPVFLSESDATLKGPAWLNNPIYYHNRGDSSFSGESNTYGDIFGLDDLFTEHPDVVNGFVDIFSRWATEFGVDGFRLDTVKHVNIEFWHQFGPAVTQRAQAAGIADFFMFGEVFEFNPAVLSRYTKEAALPSVLDFALKGSIDQFAVNSAGTHVLRDLFAADDYYTDADSNAYQLGTFISNHDVGRIGHLIRTNRAGASDAEKTARVRLAHAALFLARGFPVVYYGDEQGFVGGGSDKDSREDMFPSAVDAHNALDLIGSDATTAQSNFDAHHPLYTAIRDLAALRREHEALRRGYQIHRYSQGDAGIYAFSRITRDRTEYLIALNNSDAPASATITTFAADTTFEAVYPAGGAALTSDAAGGLTITVPGLDFVVYRAASPFTLPAPSPMQFTTVNEGDSVGGTVELAVSGNENRFGEITFAVSVDGGEWQVLGTDTNAPYRVFWDSSSVAEGTAVRFVATFDDLNGNQTATEVNAVVGDATADQAAYAIIHYTREDGDYGDNNSSDYNDFWGLHLWGDAIAPEEATDWTAPKKLIGESEYGRFAWIKLSGNPGAINFIVHRGDTKDGTDADRAFDVSDGTQIWLKGGDGEHYFSQAAAQGYATIRYQRPDGDYGVGTDTYWGLHLWSEGGANAIDPAAETDWNAPRAPDGVDDFGAFWRVPLNAGDPNADRKPLKFIIHTPGGDNTDPGGDREPGGDRQIIPAEQPATWVLAQDETLYRERGAAENFVTLHYHRPDGDYGDLSSDDFNDFWGLHVWNGAASPTGWTSPLKPAGQDGFGVFFRVPLQAGATELAYIIHRGDTKDPDADMFLDLRNRGYEVWQLSGADPADAYILPRESGGGPGGPNPGNLGEQRAYWVSRDIVLWEGAGDPSWTYRLHSSATADLATSNEGVTGGEAWELTLEPTGPGQAILAKFPHLAGLPALRVPEQNRDALVAFLRGQTAVSAVNADGVAMGATALQIPGVLDDAFAAAYPEPLGIVWQDNVPTIRVWAPTAQNVGLQLFAGPATDDGEAAAMTFDAETGIWSATLSAERKGWYYLFDVSVYHPAAGAVVNLTVTDPYSVALSLNSTRSMIVDLNDAELAPSGWATYSKPALDAPEDISIYELHVRDFSISDSTVPEDMRGKFAALTLPESNGVKHLKRLQSAGLTHLHLLPVFDIATIIEGRDQRTEPDFDELRTFSADSEMQQEIVSESGDLDGFNWGYDPYHYNVPEGSYTMGANEENPDGRGRVLEFRDMVKAVNNMGLRLVMDVVYNHTNASGLNERSVLDRIVPGYYHRLDENGNVTNSTCCDNTATEHAMMEKLMVDSLVVWARDYKVDAFRFDLMGHHMTRNMAAVRAALDALTLENDGVDGSKIYVYGEGWNFGEVVNNTRGENATQRNMAGTGIGTFSDRLRDAIRGGGPFDNGIDLKRQGFANGLHYDPNDLDQGDTLSTLMVLTDQVRVGMAGNLAGYRFIDRDGNEVRGDQVPYGGDSAGYTEDPQEVITYISKHDNQTLYDINVYGLPVETDMETRVRVQSLGLSIVMLGQGIPFFHAGVDFLRSKSLDRDSFNSGDWFNHLDFSFQTGNYGIGLPVAEKNADNWDLMAPLLADPSLKPDQAAMAHSAALFREWLAIRYSSPLFRLRTATQVQERLRYHNTGPNQQPGLIVMSLDDRVGDDLDPNHDLVVVLINANDDDQSFTMHELIDAPLKLHPVQVVSADATNRASDWDRATGTFSVPGRTTAVWVLNTAPSADGLPDAIQALCDQVRAAMEAGDITMRDGARVLAIMNAAKSLAEREQTDQALRLLQTASWWIYGSNMPQDIKNRLLDGLNVILSDYGL